MAYTPGVWAKGDIVEAEKLNHMENGIAENSTFNPIHMTVNCYNSNGSTQVVSTNYFNEDDLLTFSELTDYVNKGPGVVIEFIDTSMSNNTLFYLAPVRRYSNNVFYAYCPFFTNSTLSLFVKKSIFTGNTSDENIIQLFTISGRPNGQEGLIFDLTEDIVNNQDTDFNQNKRTNFFKVLDASINPTLENSKSCQSTAISFYHEMPGDTNETILLQCYFDGKESGDGINIIAYSFNTIYAQHSDLKKIIIFISNEEGKEMSFWTQDLFAQQSAS